IRAGGSEEPLQHGDEDRLAGRADQQPGRGGVEGRCQPAGHAVAVLRRYRQVRKAGVRHDRRRASAPRRTGLQERYSAVLRRRAGVLGRPIAHSPSPVIHHAGYRAAGLTGWTYTAIECGAEELPGFVAGLGPEWVGLSVTMPGKEAALAAAATASPIATAV